MSARLTHLPSLPLFIDSGKIYATRIQGRNTFSVGHIVKWLDMPHKISKKCTNHQSKLFCCNQFFSYTFLIKCLFSLTEMTKSHKTFCLVSVLKKGQNLIPNTCESSQLLAWHSDFLKDNSNRIKFYLVVFVYLFL